MYASDEKMHENVMKRSEQREIKPDCLAFKTTLFSKTMNVDACRDVVPQESGVVPRLMWVGDSVAAQELCNNVIDEQADAL